MTVWFTKGYRNLYNAISDLKKEHPEINVLCSHSDKLFSGFYSADFSEFEPKFKNKEHFLSFTKEMIQKYDVKLIIPHYKQEWFNEFKSFFDGLGVVVATVAGKNRVNAINNKGKFYSNISKIKGVNSPEFRIFRNYEEFLDGKKQLKNKFELCIKPSVGVYGSDFYKLSDVNKSKLNKVIARNKTMLLMQFLDGFEYSADCIAKNGQLIGFVVRKKLSPNEPQVVVNDEAINNQVRLLTEKLCLNGLFNIQFKEYQGTPFVLEINPRLSGRSYYATIAGVNLPSIAAEIFLGLKKPEEIKTNVSYGLKIGNVNQGVPVLSEIDSSKFNTIHQPIKESHD